MRNQKGQIEVVVVIVFLVILILSHFNINLFKIGNTQENKNTNIDTKAVKKTTNIINKQEKISSNATSTITIDITPPEITDVFPNNDLDFSTKVVDISLKTDEKAICRYSDIKGLIYGQMKIFSNTSSFSHSTEITGLSEGQNYIYYVKCQDQQGNTNKDDLVVAFSVKNPKDITPPQRTNAYPFGETFKAGTKEVVIGISTNEPATCRYDTESNQDYDSMNKRLEPYDNSKMYHINTINSLESGNNYDFYVKCKDLNGNENTGDSLINFNIE